MRITGDLDGGNVVVRSLAGSEASLAVRHDSNAEEFRQWFHFAADRIDGRCRFVLDVSDTTYRDAFEGYAVCTSYDGERWFRTPAELAGDSLVWELEPEAPRVRFAYFAPYSRERHRRLIRRARDGARVSVLGRSVQGRPVDLVTIGEPAEGKPVVWVIARQHPGETMAEWYAEGLVARLLAGDDEAAAALRANAIVHVVPTMNPDGGVLGNLRANAAGVNLNRMWLEPDGYTSPEVLCVRAAMEQTGVDLFLDVHGDERNPWCFLAGCEGNPGYDDRLRGLEDAFEQALLRDNEDFQDEYGYPRDEPGGGDLRTAGNWVGERFACLSYTVEMPFKDAANHPDPEVGFSPDRARRLGGSTVDAMAEVLGDLR
jgi:murein tripeptide amidase MpaA